MSGQLLIFVIDDRIRARATTIVEHASRLENYYFANRSKVPGDIPEHVLELDAVGPGKMRCVFSFTASQGSIYRHLSISMRRGDGSKTLPNPVLALELCETFGFNLPKAFGTDDVMVHEADQVIVVVQKVEVK